jgi:hypothetical protein
MKHLGSVRAGEKRKSSNEEDGEGEREASAIKKRRQDAGLEARDNVVFVPFEERLAPLPPEVDEEREGRFALLPDWKERFAEGEVMVGERREMPADMRRAAEAEGEDEEEEEGEDEMPDDGDQMEVDSDEDEEDEEDDDTAAGVDQDVIMQVLRQRLADSGLGDVDESVFKDAIAKMLSGEADGEDALGGLTSLLLGQKDGGGKAFEGFLAGQGVDLNRTEEEEEEEEGQDNNENDEDEPQISTSAPNAESAKTPIKNQLSSKTTPTHTSTPKNLTPTTRGKSKSQSARPTTSTNTGTTITTPNPKPVSPIVVPSPPPTSFRPSRKRRAPSLDELALPLPEAPSNSDVKPLAKRRRTPRAEVPPSEPEPEPAARRRTTRSAAAAGKGGR